MGIKGDRVIIRTDASGNYLTADFPGWGSENYMDHLLPTNSVAGMGGTITGINSHGSNPYTRYNVKLDNGGRLIDGVPGVDFDWN